MNIYEEYFTLNAKIKEDQKMLKSLGSEIKQNFFDSGITEAEAGEFIASVSYVDNDKLDEDKLIRLLKDKYPELCEKVIVKKEILVLDKLEDLVYNRHIDGTDIQSCVIKNEPTQRLFVRRKTHGKNNND